MQINEMNYGIVGKLRRHVPLIYNRINLKRFINISKCLFDYFFKNSKVSGKPFLLKIEASATCNLRCVGCRDKGLPEIGLGILEYDNFEKVMNPIKDYLIEASLYIWGEPLVNKKNLSKFLSYLDKNNITSVISTNAHFLTEDMAEQLVQNKLTKIIIAIDGTKQESYEKLRVGGKLDLVMNNLRMLVEKKKKYNSKYPIIEWQFVKTGFNKSEIPEALKIARELNIDEFSIIPDWSKRDDDQKVHESRSKAHKKRQKSCPWLWFATAVQWDGSLYPCCHVANNFENKFGNFDVIEAWNSDMYMNSRFKFIDKNKVTDKSSVCFRCPL
jgi:radical SAM protein with 4Fe4S-binding SPASM domain